MKKAKLTPGEFVEIPYYCFAPGRHGWNGYLFAKAQVIKVAGVNKFGKNVLTLDVCNPDGRNGEHYEKNVCEDRIFAAHDIVKFAQAQVDRAPASKYSGGRYNTVVYWLADKGLVTGLR